MSSAPRLITIGLINFAPLRLKVAKKASDHAGVNRTRHHPYAEGCE
jgi:hypothetical protein